MANPSNLKTGDNFGNKGGGATPKIIRELCREEFRIRIPALCALADEAEDDRVKLAAIEALGKYGGLQQIDITSGDEPIKLLSDAELWNIASGCAGGTSAAGTGETSPAAV